jgi:hypothetical protein
MQVYRKMFSEQPTSTGQNSSFAISASLRTLRLIYQKQLAPELQAKRPSSGSRQGILAVHNDNRARQNKRLFPSI